ncbi:DUF748 domain-containing protein [Pseudodesulfovibrio cashew]|uniref:DUF748 domain-containing protein n=1 Tax=Pseudodesulfovibrio cashew TaxID=2678688 RepID=A0A6I6J9Z3_9BACT|nr:DUF748 domain-containing protein [Pseudodesulfovibrio cashew]QGY38861.1 DUF748 domain-containing protein [Pseudodesulfovibrio cashew]
MLAFLDKIPYGTPRLRRVLFWALTLFTAYVLIGFFVLPPVVRTVIIDQATKGLNRETTLERVAFNPLTMRFELQGLRVAKLEGEGALVSIGSLSAAPGIATLWKFAPVVSYLHLRDLTVDVTFFGGGKYSISDLIGAQRKPEDESPEANETVFPFALYGFEMTNATIIFDDKPHKKRHVISNLNLLVPFTSSFLDLRKEFTQPKFTAVVNGDPVELKGRTLPFDDTLRTEFELGAVDVDLHQYWSYLPVKSPLQLVSGKFTSDITLLFERPDATRMRLFLGGGGTLTNLELSAPVDGKVLALNKLDFEMEKYSLGDNELALKSIRLDKPYCKVIRRGDGDINWTDYFPAESPGTVANNATAKTTTEKDTSLRLDIRSLEVAGGSVDWQDLTVPGGFSRAFGDIAFKGKDLSTAKDVVSSFNLSLGRKGRVSAQGTATLSPVKADVSVKAEGFSLPDYKAYLAQALPLRVDSGVAGATAKLTVSDNDGVFNLAADNATLSLSGLALSKPDAEKPSLGLKALSVTGANFDLAAGNVLVDRIELTGPSVEVVREKSGDLDLARLFAKESEPVREEQTAAEEEARQWTATVNTVRVTDGEATFRDRALKNPAKLTLNGLQATLSNLTTRQGATMRYDMSTRWGGKGEISAAGSLGLDEFGTTGRLRLKDVGLNPFDPYLGESTELLFSKGSASADLKYEYSGTRTNKYTVTGGAGLRSVALRDDSGDGEFAGFDAFTLTGVRFENEPNRLDIQSIDLDGPRAAVDFDKDGRLNIRRAFRIPEPPPVPEERESNGKGKPKQKAETPAKTAGDAPQTPAQPAEPPFFDSVKIAKVTMKNGHVTYRDASVEPVYSTVISDMTLGLVDVSQAPEARPKMEFSAKIGPTPMSVTGVLNPVITPMYSNLTVAVNGLEMVPLSPYTLKYMAYPVEKGRLYADVTFKTDNWELDASNKFFIEQLVLGPKDKRPDAPNVPVKFGLSLLQDGNGDMELNLPIRGRLDDPDFRIGGIVFKAIVSLFVKALASPFSLIGSIFGGGGENMDFVVFQPGRATLDQSGMQKLETVTKALEERQKLKLEVDGVVDPAADKAGLITAFFEAKLRQQKYESLPRKERSQTSADAMRIAPEEYEEFLYEAYAAEPDPEGIKSTTLFVTDRQPVDVMEKFIIDRIQVTQEDLNELARQRASAVKEFILARDPNLTERVYLLDRQKDAKGKTGVPKHRADLGIK